MFKFKIKLREKNKKYYVKIKNSKSFNMKIKIKGIYLGKKFKSNIKLTVCSKKNKIYIDDIKIKDIVLNDSSSSSCDLEDIYKIEKDNISFVNSLLFDNQEQIYCEIKNFVKHIKLILNKKNNIEKIVFSLKNTNIDKINLKGIIY